MPFAECTTCEKLYAEYTSLMSVQRQVKKVGGSLAVIIPRDLAEAMRVEAGSNIHLTLVGTQLLIEPAPESSTASSANFRRALASVLRTHRSTIRDLAAYDRGEILDTRPVRAKSR